MFQLSLLLLEPAWAKQEPAHLHTACVQPGINVLLPDAGGMGAGVTLGTCGCPEPLLKLFWFLLPRANPCSLLLGALLILLVVNLLPSHPWAPSLALTAQTFRHMGTGCCKRDSGQGMGHHVGTWISPSHGCTMLVTIIPHHFSPSAQNITAMLLIPHSQYKTRCHNLLSLTQVCM